MPKGSRPHVFIMCIISLFGIGILSSGCATMYWGDDSWVGQDKLYHFAAGSVIGAGTTLALKRNGVDRKTAPVFGITVSVGIGAGKEWYDENVEGTFWSWKDMVWDAVGGAAGSYAVLRSE